MRRYGFIVFTAFLALSLAVPAPAQQKPKDPVLQSAMMDSFSRVLTQLDQLSNRLAGIEAELAKVKQQQADLNTELRNAQTVLKTTDATLGQLRLSSEQGLFSLRTDLAQVRTDLMGLVASVRQNLAGSQPAAPSSPAAGTTPAAPSTPGIEGYISEVGDKDVTISLGSKAGVKEGQRLGVYKANDPKTQVGVVEVTQVLDENNSKANIIYRKPEFRFEFSDIVRPL